MIPHEEAIPIAFFGFFSQFHKIPWVPIQHVIRDIDSILHYTTPIQEVFPNTLEHVSYSQQHRVESLTSGFQCIQDIENERDNLLNYDIVVSGNTSGYDRKADSEKFHLCANAGMTW